MRELEPSSREPDEMPESREFFAVFRDVLNRWAYLDCVPQGPMAEFPTQGVLERLAPLAGKDLNGVLILRSDLAFARLLAESAAGEAADDIQAQDAFTELCNQFCSHALSRLWDAAGESFRPFLPVASSPQQWPPRHADRRCLLSVGPSPVEILFWRTDGA